MSFLERAIRKGIGDAVGKAIGGAVKDAVTPVAEKYANKAAAQIDQAAESTSRQLDQSTAAMQEAKQQDKTQSNGFSNLEGALGNFQRSMENYATEAAKNMKTCPACGETTTAEKKFCPSCGAKLPEQTIAQGAICPQCGKQNKIGTRFCQDCGTKLPATIAEEQAEAEKNAAVLAQWDTILAGFPKWTLGGNSYRTEPGDVATLFSVTYPTAFDAKNAVTQYRAILKQNGFKEEGEYPDVEHLFKKVNGVSFHVDTEHCFEGDSETADIYFMHDEPVGGYNYVKPQPKKGLFDFFK